MNISELINEIISEWAYRVNDGMPDAKNQAHLKELSIVLKEMGLSHIKDTLIENLLTEKGKTPQEIEEADKSFTNPILNKKVSYKNDKGENKEGIVGNLLRQPEGSPARTAAERMLPPEGSPEREELNQELGGEGQAKKPEDGAGAKGGEEGGAPKEDPIKKAAVMFDPKADPAMAARMDREKEANAKIAAGDAKDDKAEEEPNPLDAKFNPIDAQDVQAEMPQADPDTFGGGSDIPDGVPAADLQQFNTDINKVAKQVADAKAKGEPAPNINLCDVTIPGTNLYCDDNLGIPRDEMPQFKGNAQPGSRAAGMEADKSGEVDTEPVFRKMLDEKGITVLQTEVPADKLKATQKDLVGAKVVGMMGALEEDPNHPKITAPIYVSRDGYVIDGHHRWAAVVAYNAQHPENQIPMKTTVLDMDIKDAIPMANKFAEDMGIAAKKADANKETPTSTPDGKINPIAKKAIEKIKDGVKNWSVEEKEFFNKKVHKGNSPERRTFSQTFKDKAKGAWEAIKHGAQHEVHTFKEAGTGVKNFFSGGKVSESEKKALIEVAKKVAMAAAFGVAGGGLAHGAAAFGKHLMVEFVPHVVAETVLMGAGKAALFAGDADSDADMMKFMEIISKKLENADIPEEIMADAIESYNENKQPEMKEEHLDLANELMLEMIYGFIDEARQKITDFPAISKETGKLVYFDTKDAQQDAIKSGTHSDSEANKQTNEPVAGAGLFDDPEYQKRRGAETKPTATKKQNTQVNYDSRVDGETSSKVEQTYNADSKFSEPGMKHEDRVKRLKAMKAREINSVKIDEVYTAMGIQKGTTKFPAKYMSVLSNALNYAKGPFTITDLTDAAGAGTLDSTLGELVTMMGATVQDEAQRKQFFDYLRAQVKAGGNASALTVAWINSAQDSCEAFHRKIQKDCPGGHEVKTNFWDIPSEAQAAGVKNYKRDKGKSTDINTMVDCISKDGSRTQKWLQPSLKKSKKVNAFNSTTGRVFATTVLRWGTPEEKAQYSALGNELDSYNGLDDNAPAGDYKITDKKGNTRPMTIKERKTQLNKSMREIENIYEDKIPAEANPKEAVIRQAKLHKDYLNDKQSVKERDNFLYNWLEMKPSERKKVAEQIAKQMGQKGDKYAKELEADLNKLSQYDTSTSEGLDQALTELGFTASKDKQKMMVAIINGVINTQGEKTKSAQYKKIMTKNSHDHSKAVLEYLIRDNDNKKALLENISTQFPLKDLIEGKEWAILGEKGGGINLDRDTITKCLGADKFEDVVEKLIIVDYKGEPTLAYAADNGSRTVPIGEINCRPDGIMYGGSWKLELSIHDGFAECCKTHDK